MSEVSTAHANERSPGELEELAARIKDFGRKLGFARLGIVDVEPGKAKSAEAEARLMEWLALGFHGEMGYMARHGPGRARPTELVPGTLRVIAARMDYLPVEAEEEAGDQHWIDEGWDQLGDPLHATVSRYAHGRDYHKVMRRRLKQLAAMIEGEIGPFGYRVFTDSAPVMEVELARRAGIGWRGKHTLLLSRDAGSMYFLGELFVDVPLPVDAPVTDHCGSCSRCIEVCPTQAIVAPYRLDARRCISYLTIELKGTIPIEFRPLIGNRIYGCDDCQLVCPWNKYAQRATVKDFDSRATSSMTLIAAFGWSEDEFGKRTEGSAIHRIGYERWLRNVAIGLGNAFATKLSQGDRDAVAAALNSRANDASPLVREHVAWALAQARSALG